MTKRPFIKGCGIALGIVFLPFGEIFGSAVLSIFLAICSILKLEATISQYCKILEFEPLIFRGICNILVLKLCMLDGILRLGGGFVFVVAGFVFYSG